MSRLNDLRTAADDTATKALQKINMINASQFQRLILELKKNSVDTAIISQLETTINDATRRNQLLSEFIKKGESIGIQIMKILNTF